MRHSSSATLVRLVALLLLLGACDDARDNRSLANIDELPRLTVRQELRIGSAHDPDTGFTRVGPLAVDDEGNTYVAEMGEDEVRVYGADGRRIRVIGRRGEGPGEFQSVMRMGLIGDTLWVGDVGNRRVTLFSRDGRVLSTIRAPEHVFRPEPGLMFRLMGASYRGNGHLESTVSLYALGEGVERAAVAVPRLLFDTSGAIVDTIGFQGVTIGPIGATRVNVGGRELAMPRVRDDTLRIDVEDGSWVVSRTMATSDAESSVDVVRLSLGEDTIHARTFRYRPSPFESWYLDTMAVRFAGRFRSSPNLAPAALERAVRENVTLPGFQPPVASARASEDGGLWLRRDSDYHSTHRWIVLSADGTPRGELALPSNVDVRWSSGDGFWAVVPDDLDVPWLVRYRIVAR